MNISPETYLCQTCEQKTTPCTSTNNNIWDFNPYLYPTFYEMTHGFREFYEKYNQSQHERPNSFYETYNEDGYTYSQWYVYFISKNYYRYKDLKKQTYWFFQIMAGYDFFKKMVRIGKRDDALHTTLHHFLKYLDNFTWYTNKIIELLQDNGLKLEEEDGEGMSGNDYLAQHLLSPEDLEHSKKLTGEYKRLEESFYKHPFFSDFKRCQRCHDFLDIYQEMIRNKEKMKEMKVDIINIIKKRQECIDVYLKYPNCENSTKRHQYIVDLLYLSITDH